MSNRLVLWMTVLVLIGIGILFALNMASLFRGQSPASIYLKHNNVRGIAVKHENKLYTLNFTQQNDVVDWLNGSVPIEEIKSGQQTNPVIEQIVIYQFGEAKDLILTPVAYVDHNLIYSIPDWNPKGYMMDVSEGRLQNLLSQTYDP
jgi:hypothetical protein